MKVGFGRLWASGTQGALASLRSAECTVSRITGKPQRNLSLFPRCAVHTRGEGYELIPGEG